MRIADCGLKQEKAMSEGDGKFGARVYKMVGGVWLVKQTVKRGKDYVIDHHKEKHVNPGEFEALGRAVSNACDGNLLAGKARKVQP
jgi:hypothetical protein